MTTLEERLEDEEYKLWVKAGICIAAVKNGLEEFARTRSQRAHTHVKTALNNNTAINNLCPNANIQFDKRLKKWTLGCCPDCQVYVDDIENLKNPPFTFKLSNWNNTDITQWPNKPWEMMKVYMNAGQKAAQKDPKESDLSAILNFIAHCRIPIVDIHDQNNIAKVREARNEIMHSAQMKISLGDFQKHTKAMIDLLEDQTFLYKLQDAKDAVKIIKEVQGASFCITRSDEVKALNEKTTAISERNITFTAEIAELRSEQEHIKKSVDSGIEKLETLVKTETEDRQQALDRLTKEIETKDKALKKLSVEISFVNRRINQDKALYRKMDIRVKTVEKSIRKTEKEFKGIKQEHSDMKNDLDEIKSRLQIKNGSVLKIDNTKDHQTLLKRVNEEQERKIGELQLELNEKHTHHEQDVSKLRTRIRELEQENEIYSRRKEANSFNQETKQDTELVNKLRDKNKELTLAYEKLNDYLRNLTESTVQETQKILKEATEMNDALQYDNSVLKVEIEKLKSKAENNLSNVELQEYENRNANQENEIDRLRFELHESDQNIKEAQERLQKNHKEINELEAKLQREMSNAEIIKTDKLNREEVLRDLTKDGAMLLSEAANKLADVQNHIQHTIDPDGDLRQLEDNADDEIKTLIKSLFSMRRTLTETNVDKLKQLIIEMIADLKEKFDREHQLRNTAEKGLNSSQKTYEELTKKIEELQNQVQTEKNTNEALDERYKLSALDAETARKDISELQQKLDQENQLRNTAETSLKASQKTNEELSIKIEELQKQVQTEKVEMPEFQETSSGYHEGKSAGGADISSSYKTVESYPVKTMGMEDLLKFKVGILKGKVEATPFGEDLDREGVLHFKIDQSKGKRADARSWKRVRAVLHDCSLYVIDVTKESSERNDPNIWLTPPISFYNDVIEIGQSYKKQTNVFRLRTPDASEYLFQAKEEKTKVTWLEALERARTDARSWKRVRAVLHDCVLYVIDPSVQPFEKYEQRNWLTKPISLRGDRTILVQSDKSKKNVFRVQTADASEYLFQAEDEKAKVAWTEALQQTIDSIKHDPELPGAKMENENDMTDMKVVSSRTVDAKLKDDGEPPLITGCVFLSTGQLVLCDTRNKKIKLLRSDLRVEDSLDLQGRQDSLELQGRYPFDISAVSSSSVIITLPVEQELQYIELTPRLQLGRVIKLDKMCWGVCVFGEEIYVTCSTSGEEGEVRVLDINGLVKRRLGVPSDHHSSYMFSQPEYVSVSAVTGRIYVSDRGRDTLTCLSKDGSIIYRYRDPELRDPRGLYLDPADNVIVCGFHSDNLLIISPRGEKISSLLSEKDGIKYPVSVAYRSSDGTLVVGCGDFLGDNKLHVFKLSH